jgi:hypothetical protein
MSFLAIALMYQGFTTLAKPANCVLSAKIKYFREERSVTQGKPAIARNRCYAFGVLTRKPPMYKI